MVDRASGSVLQDEEGEAMESALRFDHGCQFFTAASPRFQGIVEKWVADGAVREWKGNVGVVPGPARGAAGDFFGSSTGLPLFVGVGGMHRVAHRLAERAVSAGVTLHKGVRVSSLQAGGDGSRWILRGVGGEAAFHDTAETVAAAAETRLLAEADVVVLTDASCSFEGWHRASAGIATVAPDMAAAIRSRARVPLFTAMAAFESHVSTDLDAFVVCADLDSPLWYASRSASKPGLRFDTGTPDCWTLVSRPAFAASEIQGTEMQDPHTGAFRPQEDAYLNGRDGPAERLVSAFEAALGGQPLGKPTYLQGQRWGSAFPAPVRQFASVAAAGQYRSVEEAGVGGSRVEVMGVTYETATPDLRPTPGASATRDGEQDFFMDTAAGLYYASDFCSTRLPGVEAAVLSALDAAEHILGTVESSQ
jgi:predicted NAD/FAD-dependent oxidoreductase